MAYIWVRFGNLKYGTATVVALLHDTLFTLAAIGFAHYLADTFIGDALLIEPFRINLTLVAAILTVMGYSMNDTVVVFDRIRENRGKFGHVSRQVINDSINQTLSPHAADRRHDDPDDLRDVRLRRPRHPRLYFRTARWHIGRHVFVDRDRVADPAVRARARDADEGRAKQPGAKTGPAGRQTSGGRGHVRTSPTCTRHIDRPGKDARMQKELKIGMAIGAVLLVVLIVYLAVPKNDGTDVAQDDDGDARRRATSDGRATARGDPPAHGAATPTATSAATAADAGRQAPPSRRTRSPAETRRPDASAGKRTTGTSCWTTGELPRRRRRRRRRRSTRRSRDRARQRQDRHRRPAVHRRRRHAHGTATGEPRRRHDATTSADDRRRRPTPPSEASARRPPPACPHPQGQAGETFSIDRQGRLRRRAATTSRSRRPTRPSTRPPPPRHGHQPPRPLADARARPSTVRGAVDGRRRRKSGDRPRDRIPGQVRRQPVQDFREALRHAEHGRGDLRAEQADDRRRLVQAEGRHGPEAAAEARDGFAASSR